MIFFFGSSYYSLPILEALYTNSQIVAVITQPDKPIGRKRSFTPPFPKQFAQSRNIRFFTPIDKKGLLELKDQMSLLGTDLAIVADYGLIIPGEIIDIPQYKTLNIHFSRLPDLRGPSPVQYTVLRGDKSAWISIIIMDEGVDSGDILWQKEVPLEGSETTDTLYKKLFDITALELSKVINQYVQKKLTPQKQNHSKATYTKAFTREDGYIPPQLLDSALNGINSSKDQINRWSLAKYLFYQSPITNFQLPILIERTIRAFTPWPGVWTNIKITDNKKQLTKRLKILKAHLEKIPAKPIQLNYVSRYTDVVSNLHILVRLAIDKVQLEGKKPVSFKQLQEGYPDIAFT